MATTETQKTDAGVDGTVQMMSEAQLREPKAPVGLYTLPCGYLDAEGVLHTDVVVNELSGREEDLLGSDKIPDHKKPGALLGNCIARIGSLTDREKILAAIPELLIGDRVFLVIAIRRTSFGDNYPYNDKCPECGQESLMNINLATLDVTPMPNPSKRIYDVKLPSKEALREWSNSGAVPAGEKLNPTGRVVRFRPANGRDEEKFGKVISEEEAISKSLQQRIELLDGKPPTVDALQVLTFNERAYIRQLFEDADGGVETTLDVTCPNCEAEYKRELNTRQLGFFFPSAARKNSKTRSST